MSSLERLARSPSPGAARAGLCAGRADTTPSVYWSHGAVEARDSQQPTHTAHVNASGRNAVTRWWSSADDASALWLIALVGLPWFLSALLRLIGIDRMTALQGLFHVTGWAVLLVLPIAARIFFGPSEYLQSRRPLGFLKRDRPGVWVLAGIGFSLASAFAFGGAISCLSGALAEHVDGQIIKTTGVVTSTLRGWGAQCRLSVQLHLEGEPSDIWTCIRIGRALQVADYVPQPGDGIRVTYRTNRFGRVALELRKADPRL